MAKRIEITGAKPKKIEIADTPKRRLDAAELAAALGASPAGLETAGHLDLIGLGELGTQLLARLRSTGGRPALTDATEMCRVPLSTDDVKTLEGIVAQIEDSSGARPSVGQLVSVIVRAHLESLRAAANPTNTAPPSTEPESTAAARLHKMIDEHLTPLREKMNRLETELHALRGKK